MLLHRDDQKPLSSGLAPLLSSLAGAFSQTSSRNWQLFFFAQAWRAAALAKHTPGSGQMAVVTLRPALGAPSERAGLGARPSRDRTSSQTRPARRPPRN